MIEFVLLTITLITFLTIVILQIENENEGLMPNWCDYWIMYGIAVIYAFGYFVNLSL